MANVVSEGEQREAIMRLKIHENTNEYAATVPFSDLIGRTIKGVFQKDNDELHFYTTDHRHYRQLHHQDCCESVWLDDVSGGELKDLIGAKVLNAEENSESNPDAVESGTWTFYRITTFDSTIVIRWNGDSNGYYSESVDFELLSKGE